MMRRGSFVAFSIFLTVPLVRATPIPVTGNLTLIWNSYAGTTSGVNVDTPSGPAFTGEISFRLDPTFGNDNFFSINFTTGATSLRLHLLVDSPLLTMLGAADTPIDIYEQGPLDTIPFVEPNTIADIAVAATLTGGDRTERPARRYRVQQL